MCILYTVSQKNDTDVAQYNFNAHQSIFLISIPCLINYTALACYIFDIHQLVLIFFADNKDTLLSTVCKYYFSPSHFVFETLYIA